MGSKPSKLNEVPRPERIPRSDSSEDARRAAQRQKQIDYGKNTLGYQNYVQAVPKLKRKREDPKTPDVNSNCSKRCFDGLVRVWRKALHKYDPSAELEKEPMEFAVGAAANATTTSNTVDCGDTCGQGAAGKKRVFGDAFQWVQSAQRSPKKPSDSVQGGSGGPGSHIDADQQSLSSAACEERRRMPAGGPQTVLDLLLDDRSNESWGVAGYGTVPVAAPTSVPAVSKPLHTGSWADDVEDDDVDVQL